MEDQGKPNRPLSSFAIHSSTTCICGSIPPHPSLMQDPIEVGCGSTQLGSRPWLGREGHFDCWLDDQEFAKHVVLAKEEYDVEIRDREHLAYFQARPCTNTVANTCSNGEVAVSQLVTLASPEVALKP